MMEHCIYVQVGKRLHAEHGVGVGVTETRIRDHFVFIQNIES